MAVFGARRMGGQRGPLQPHLLFPNLGQVLSKVPDGPFQMPGLRGGESSLGKPQLHKPCTYDVSGGCFSGVSSRLAPHRALCSGPAATPAADLPRVPRAIPQRPREHHCHRGLGGFAVKLILQDLDVELSQDCEPDSVTITASGVDPSWFYGQVGSSLGSPAGQREFVSSGNSLRLTFRAPASSEDRTTGLHKGFLVLYQAVSMNHSRPISQVGGGSEAAHTPGDNSSKIQNQCQEPYYQVVPAETLTCRAQSPGKETLDKEEAPHCVPASHPITQNQEAQSPSKAKLGNFPWQAFTNIYGRGGGALLGDRWILTAAHTIYPKDSIFLGKKRNVDVFLGHTAIDEMIKLGNHPVRRVVVHPDYRQNESHNFNGDIALLELQHSVPLGPHLLPVCLPDNETLYRRA
ncbi:hypothetical protein QTO34_017840 [Cnephaeus nilssonii]|uniref:Peptidase S1 domain-containing protein n=1 Tax=Cnephaeus nilssonii TaxID=3371016 RepID=A0AA40I1W6_CNENI|nr:hypothetical protein QTO34_017840 [Eptesicus nilssonii]